MRPNRILLRATALGLFAMVVCAAPAPADDFAVPWYTIDAGGGQSAGGDFVLSGTIGQPDAGPTVLTGGDFTLTGGFWAGGAPPEEVSGDLDGDGDVDFDDLNLLLASYGVDDGGDLDGDGDTDFDDLNILLANYGYGVP